jgi:hypothetical protein
MLYIPNEDVYNLLKDIEGVQVAQPGVKTLTSLPAITFSVSGNIPTEHLNGDIAYQDMEIKLDIWTGDSDASNSLLVTVEGILRGASYRMVFCTEVDDPGGTSHITTRFNLIS